MERALDEESEMQAVYHLQGVQPLPWASVAYLSCMQALTVLKHRESPSFSHALR